MCWKYMMVALTHTEMTGWFGSEDCSVGSVVILTMTTEVWSQLPMTVEESVIEVWSQLLITVE